MSEFASFGDAITRRHQMVSFRHRFSKMRSAMALHHASWPVISIELDNPTDVASVQTLRAAYRECGSACNKGPVSGVAKSQVSRLVTEIDERVNALLTRPIEGEWPCARFEGAGVSRNDPG